MNPGLTEQKAALKLPKPEIAIIDLFGNSVSSLTSHAKYCVFCNLNKEVVRKLKFPNNSNIYFEDLCYQAQQAVEKVFKGMLIFLWY